MDSNERMIAAQADLITRLNNDIRNLQNSIERLKREQEARRRSADFYDLLQKTIMSDPVIASAWQQFIVVAKLCGPNVAGIDKPELED